MLRGFCYGCALVRSAPQELGQASSQYELVARLTEGGMAEIFLARSRGMANFGRYVVLKRILPERGADERWIEMFLDEARLVAQLQHPNIAHVFDLGRLGDGYFFTMEYVHGANMREVLVRCSQRGRRLPLAAAVGVGVGAASGLDHAHSRKDAEGRPLGIVHRDVSPSNLMLSFEGVVKLVDFGVAKAMSHSSVTQSGTVKGKVSYLSPEQCRGRAVDHRSDLFALGIVLYEMTTTKRLYRRSSDFETMSAIVNEVPEPPSRYNPEISPSLDALILRALEKDPAHRQQSAGELLEELEDIAHKEGMAISSSQLRRQMRELFGEQPEPWHLLESGIAPPKREVEVTYTADGLLEEDLESVEVPVVQGLDYGVSGPVAAANVTAPLKRSAEPAGLAPRVTQAFPVEVAAEQVPLLDSLRAAMQAAGELEAERSVSAHDLVPASASEPGVTAAHGAITLTAPSGPPGGAATAGSGAMPRATSEPAPVSRPPSQPPVGSAPNAPRLSEAMTIPNANADRPVEKVPQAPRPTALAGGQVSIGSSASPGIWDRPLAVSAPAPEPARTPHATPGYAPKATLLGSAPPPAARTAPRPEPEARSPGAPDASRSMASAGMGHPAPSYGPPSPAASYPPAYPEAAPVYPRAPAEVTDARRHLPEPAAPRRWPAVAALAALLVAGVAIGALLARGEDAPQAAAPADAAQLASATDAAALASPPPDAGAAAAIDMAPDAAVAADAATALAVDAAATQAAVVDAPSATPSVAIDAGAAAPPEAAPRTAAPSVAECRTLTSNADEALRSTCVVLLCQHKQLDSARRLAKLLSGAAMREVTKACPSLTPSTRPPTRPKPPELPVVPDKPPCTGPLCRR